MFTMHVSVLLMFLLMCVIVLTETQPSNTTLRRFVQIFMKLCTLSY